MTTDHENDLAPAPEDAGAALSPLLDGARSPEPDLPADLREKSAVAADPALPLDERLEAFEDILDSEVGDTSLVRARNLERETGLRQIYLKFEGGNPTGSQKDRIAFAQVLDALRRGFDTITLATCGNYGAAVALAARLAGIRCLVHLPASYHSRRVDEMTRHGAELERVPGDYEAAVEASRARAAADELYDANPGGENLILQLQAYGEIAYELYDELRDAPAAVALPVSNGTTLAGVHHGFIRLQRRGKTSRMPRMVAGSSFRKNPIVRAVLSGAAECTDLEPARIHETVINEPLINWHSIDGDQALGAIRGTGGFAGHATDKLMRRYSRLLLDREGLSVLPASTAGLIALLEAHRHEPLPSDRYVAVLTGRK